MVYKYNFDKVQPGAHQLIVNSKYKERFDILVEYLYKYDKKIKDETLKAKQALQTLMTFTPPLTEEQYKIIYRGLFLILDTDKFNPNLVFSGRLTKEMSEDLFKIVLDVLNDPNMLLILKKSLNVLKEKGESSIAITNNPIEKPRLAPQTKPTRVQNEHAEKERQNSRNFIIKCNKILSLYEQMQNTNDLNQLKSHCEALSHIYSDVYAQYMSLRNNVTKRQMAQYMTAVALKYQKARIIYDIVNTTIYIQEMKRQQLAQGNINGSVYYKNALNIYNHLITKINHHDMSVRKLYEDPDVQKQMNHLKHLIEDAAVNFNNKPKPAAKEERPKAVAFLTPSQIQMARLYFKENPRATKLSKNMPLLVEGKEKKLPYSVIKSNDGKLYAIYSGDKVYGPKNIKGLLGKGSYGRVKLAQSLDDGRLIAAKIQMISTQQQLDEMQKEEDIQEAVNQYLGSRSRRNYRHQTKHYTFSEFIEGQSLTNYFEKNPRLPRNQKLRIILETLKATQGLHDKKIIHGDLSFNNILYDSKTGKVTIIDFGFADKAGAGNLIKLPFKVPFNAKGYYAPEAATGEVSYGADVYSLGKWISWYVAGSDVFLRDLSAKMTDPSALRRLNVTSCIREIEKKLNEGDNPFSRFGTHL